MKSNFIILLLTVFAFVTLSYSAKCQQKVFQPDPTKKLPITLDVTTGQLSSYIFVLQQGGPDKLSQSQQFSAFQVSKSLKEYQAVLDTLGNTAFRHFQEFYKTSEAKWAADTLKAFKQSKKQ